MKKLWLLSLVLMFFCMTFISMFDQGEYFFSVKSVYADSGSPYSQLSSEQRAATLEVDQEIRNIQEEIDSANTAFSLKTKVFYENYVLHEATKSDFVEVSAAEAALVPSGDEIGTVIGLEGSASALKDQTERSLKKGSFVYEKETIITRPHSNVEIRFLDDTIFSQGPDSALVLDEYVFNPRDMDSSGLSFNMMQGSFRHVTGRIAEQNPERVTLESPLSWFGIRGTTTVHMIAPMESHGVEELSRGASVVIRDHFDEVQIISSPMVMVDVFPDRPMSPQRPMTPAERDFFHSISPAALEAQRPESASQSLLDLQYEILSMNESLDINKNRVRMREAERDRVIRQSWGCFPADAKVMMEDGNTRRFADIRPGDMVMTYDIGYDMLVAKPVLEVYHFYSDHLYTINGHFVTTGGERLLSCQGWKKVNSLRTGDFVLMDQQMVEIKSIDYHPADLKVYNLHVADTHNFYVSSKDSGSYLVHNCGGGGGGGGGK